MISARDKFCKDLYLRLIRKFKIICSANYIAASESSPDCIAVTLKESDLVKESFKKTTKFYFEQKCSETGFSQYFSSPYSIHEDEKILIRSHSPDYKTQILVTKKEKKGKDLYIEVWNQYTCLQSVNIKKHLKFIYNDAVFGGICWSPSMNRIAFVAEPTQKEIKPLWDDTQEYLQSLENPFQENDSENLYNRFKYYDEFGEKMDGKIFPTLIVYDIPTNKIFPIDISQIKVDPATPIFANDNTIIFKGIEKLNTRYGIFDCHNYPTKLYSISQIDSESPKIQQLTKEFSCLSPTLSPDKKSLLYFAAEKEFVSHMTCFSLRSLSWPIQKDEEPEIIISEVMKPESEDSFHGLFLSQTISSTIRINFLHESRYLLLNCIKRQKIVPYIVDRQTKSLTELNHQDYGDIQEKTILDVNQKNIILECSSMNHPPKLLRIKDFEFEGEKLNFEKAKWEEIESTSFDHLIEGEAYLEDAINNFRLKKLNYKGIEGFLWYPTHGDYKNKKLPLILFNHAGPNSTFQQPFSAFFCMLLTLGYAILGVNYHGSYGYGQEFLNRLVGKASTIDVEESGEMLKVAIHECPDKIDPENISVFGSSHGGFLSAWLISHPKYCKLFRSAVILNPVIDFFQSKDLDHWCFAQVFGTQPHWPVSQDEVLKAHAASPLSQVNNVVTPSLIVIGGSDRTIYNSNGLTFYRALKQRGVEAKVLNFAEDGHYLNSAKTMGNLRLNMINWIEKHKKT